LERRSEYDLCTYVRGGEQLEQGCTMTSGQVLDMNVITNLRPPKTDPLDHFQHFEPRCLKLLRKASKQDLIQITLCTTGIEAQLMNKPRHATKTSQVKLLTPVPSLVL